ncbi:hypothetical protein Rumeso_04194 [Rubellimicrobium mesophilum DSM 19309]|uniref:Uncharacterized protein n=1 Tax=Rubellimicrobium mesophilum DSM 19309 TaxID=442562 RepID=A0A017HJB8_9RHOB|nr:hypothetical protein [Rubellimicrobium mesophilum]EYD74258.1 hypothetical protein Rumeso_04194 [Rubellimicrobium mesophilum DSM 19309]
MTTTDPRRAMILAAVAGAMGAATDRGLSDVRVQTALPPPKWVMPPPVRPPSSTIDAQAEAVRIRAVFDAASPEARRLFLGSLIG